MSKIYLSISEIAIKILDFIFPIECLSCELYGSYLCASCSASLKFREGDECLFCQQQTVFLGICGQCRQESALDGVFIAYDYDSELIKKLIWQFKFNYVRDLGRIVADLLSKYLIKRRILSLLRADKFDLVPIPLFAKKQRFRGFNQASVIAAEIALLNSDFKLNDCLIRGRDTSSQIGLEKIERRRNIRDAFILREGSRPNDHVFVIDDVTTTGSTLEEAALVLKCAGVKKVYGLVFSHRK